MATARSPIAARKAGLADQLGGLNMVQADYNNDGCMDILVLRGGWEIAATEIAAAQQLRRNVHRRDAARRPACRSSAPQTAVWADIDNDGLLDLFVGNENGPSQLFRNKGDGTFEDISHAVPAWTERPSRRASSAADYDNDGFVDLYVSNLRRRQLSLPQQSRRHLYRSREQAGVQAPVTSFAAWFFDYDNDGWPDLFVTSYYMSPRGDSARTYLGLPHNAETSSSTQSWERHVSRCDGRGRARQRVFDADGREFRRRGQRRLPRYLSRHRKPAVRPLFSRTFCFTTAKERNLSTSRPPRAPGNFTRDTEWHSPISTTMETRTSWLRSAGPFPGDSHAIPSVRKPGQWQRLDQPAPGRVKSNRAAIGARIKLTVHNGGEGQRFIFRTVGSGGSFGASPLQQHIGLGRDARILNLEIWWPATDSRQNFTGLEKNQFLEIKEFAKDYAKLDRPRYQLGGKARTAIAKQAAAAKSIKR